MKTKSFSNAGFSRLKYLGGISIIRPMVAMLLIMVLLSTATVTNAQQVTVSRDANKYIQIGSKVLGMIPNPYVKAFGGAVGFLFAEEKLPEYAELKASLEKAWLLDIDDSRKDAYKAFIIARRNSYQKDLATINTFDKRSRPEALAEAARVATVVFTDIPFFHQNEGGKPYPAGPTLPYLYSAMGLYLDLLKTQIDWRQLELNSAVAAGNAEKMTEERGRRDSLVEQYNIQLVDFWKTLQKESVRAKKERNEQVVCSVTSDGDNGGYFFVRDKYYGREDEGYGPNLKYYKHVESVLGLTDVNGELRAETARNNIACERTKLDARVQITRETNVYDLANYGLYRTTFDNRAPILYACSEKIGATKANPSAVKLLLVCPVPGGGAIEQGELSVADAGDYINILVASDRYPPNGSLLVHNEDGSSGLVLDAPPMGSQTVTNTDDSGPGSLRQAIEDGGYINIDAIQGQTITLTSGPLYIYARDVKIMADNLKQPVKLVGQKGDKIFVISGGTMFYNDHGTTLYNLLDVDGKDMICGVNPSVTANAPPVTTCPGVIRPLPIIRKIMGGAPRVN